MYPSPLTAPSLAALVPCSHGGCPLGVDVPGIAEAVRAGDHSRAYLLARAANPLASSCGHGCHAPCESACRRGRAGAPVAIAALEAYASGFSLPALLAGSGPCTTAHDARSVAALAGRSVDEPHESRPSGRRVAVVGAGAAGMACAHDLLLLGHDVELFDGSSEPGGLLTRGLPDFRFPVAAVRAECAAILARGARLRGGNAIAGAKPLQRLLADGFDAVFLAIGASAPVETMLPEGDPHAGVVDAYRLLTDGDIAVAGRVVVIGEGDLAVDAARVALRRLSGENPSGDREPTASVQLVLTRPVHEAGTPAALLAAAMSEGVQVHHGYPHVQPRYGKEGGQLLGVEVRRDGSAAASQLRCDQLVLAAPRVPATEPFVSELAVNAAGFIDADAATLRSSMRKVWAGGACAFGHRTIAHAVADGKRAAWEIHAALAGRRVAVSLASAWTEADGWQRSHAERAVRARRVLPLLADPPVDPFSSEALAGSEAMLAEANRCFDCTALPHVGEGCTGCGECVSACPAGALSLAGEAERRAVLDEGPCTRCGICVARCPEGAIAIVRAVWEERVAFEG